MKRFLTMMLVLAMVLSCGTMTLQAHAAERNTVNITVAVPESVKIGQPWADVTPEITVEGMIRRYNAVLSQEPDAVYFDTSMQPFVQSFNGVYITLCVYADLPEGMMISLPDPTEMTFTVNGQTVESYNVMKEMDMYGREFYRVRSYVELSITGRTTYRICADTTQYEGGYCVKLDGMPAEAEAGANVRFRASFGSDYHYSDIYTVEQYTVNGEPIAYDEYFVMPAQDVTVSAEVTDKYEGWQYVPEVNITLDFKDQDVYYGNRIPTPEEFYEALSVTCSTPGVNVYIREADIDTMWDESTGGDLPWVGNQFLSFWVEAEEGYLLANPYLSDYYVDEYGNWSNPIGEWCSENLKITVNGVERQYIAGDGYADGYAVSGYFVSGTNIEIHVFWFTNFELDMDLSAYQPGDTVVIPDNLWVWDGYMPTGYMLQYWDDECGEMTELVFGKSFIMPDVAGEITVLAQAVRGKFNPQPDDDDTPALVVQQSQDSDGMIDLEVQDGTFPDVTVLQINKVNGDDFYGQGYEILDLVNRVLSDVADDTVTFELKAISYNQEVQPTEKILVTFPIPEGFNSQSIAFYHVSKGGTYEIVPALIDHENGVCRAWIDHFSTYTIVSLNNHFEHELYLVPEEQPSCFANGHRAYYACTGCEKWFFDELGQEEIEDQNSIYVGYEPRHTGGTATCCSRAVCEGCGQPYGDFDYDNHVMVQVTTGNTADGVILTWETVGAEHYAVFRRAYENNVPGNWEWICDTPESTYTDTTAANGVKYGYMVQPAFMEGQCSEENEATVLRLDVVSVTTENTPGGIKLTWTANGTDVKYFVYRSAFVDDVWTEEVRLAVTMNGGYTDLATANGVLYDYRVVAVKGTQRSADSAGTQQMRLTLPSVSATNQTNGILLTWKANSAAEVYEIYRSSYNESKGTWTAWGKAYHTTTELQYLDTAAQNGTRYRYTVRVRNGDYISGYKDSAALYRLERSIVQSVTPDDTDITITWNINKRAQKYYVYRCERVTGSTVWSSWKRIEVITDSSVVTYTDTTAEAGKTYRYRVTAVRGTDQSAATASQGVRLP